MPYMYIYIYILLFIYIYIYVHTLKFIVFRYLRKCQQILFICSYTQIITLNLIETFKLTIYNTKQANTQENTFSKIPFSQKSILCQKLEIHSNHRFPFLYMTRLKTILKLFPLSCCLSVFRHYHF